MEIIHEHEENWPLLKGITTNRIHKQHIDIADQRQKLFFGDLYQQFYPRILAFLRFRVGSETPAEDLTALVFERALTHFADLQSPEAAGAWLFRIARNCASNYMQRQRSELSLDMVIEIEHPCTPSPEETVVADEDRMNLLAHINHLSEREREVIGLKFVAQLHNRDIARILGIPEGTVGSLLYRTLGKLRNALQKEGGQYER
jgi:RNA polymerase sigma factor (sigma-70 family)